MAPLLKHVRQYVVKGFLALIPLALSVFAIRLLYELIDNKLMGWIDQVIGRSIPGLGIVFLIIILYLLGIMASNFLGAKAIGLIEKITDKIPLLKTTYNIGKQISNALTLPERQLFKKVVLIDFLKQGMWTVGFVTGELTNEDTKEKLLKVYVPTPPNPTSGTIVIVKKEETQDPGWTIDEALKMIVSAGIIGPEKIKIKSEK